MDENGSVHTKIIKHQKDIDIIRRELINVSVHGLTQMFDAEKQLFHFRVRRSKNKIIKEGHSRRYTIISLLGLHKYEEQGLESPISVQRILTSLLNDIKTIDNIGDIGLLLWLCALASPKNLKEIYSHLKLDNILKSYPDAYEGRTMELAWFLTGLSHSALALEEYSKSLEELATRTYQFVIANYGDKGIFGHQNKVSLIGKIRGRVGSFADQVYPIYAFSKFSKAFGSGESLKIALECAETICKHQGTLGQWWWHYDELTGNVIGKYPVYSVHQDGMAPMALFAISEVSGKDFSSHIYKGLNWIGKANELKFDLIDSEEKMIWRSFYRNKHKMYFEEALSMMHLNSNKKKCQDIKINFECRPYHFGWLLYAFAPLQTFD